MHLNCKEKACIWPVVEGKYAEFSLCVHHLKSLAHAAAKTKPSRSAPIYNGKVLHRDAIDPKKVEYLNKVRWLSRDEIASLLGITRHGVNNIVSRYKLSRILPEICKIVGCGKPAYRFRHCKGWIAGNLCLEHKREKAKAYTTKSRRKYQPLKTFEERSAQATRAAQMRWAKKNESKLKKDLTSRERKLYAV